MTNREEMLKCLAKIKLITEELNSLVPVIAREVETTYGRKIRSTRDKQEQDNLRQYYTIQVGKENIWKQKCISDRDLYIRLATMHGIAALVEQTEVRLEPF